MSRLLAYALDKLKARGAAVEGEVHDNLKQKGRPIISAPLSLFATMSDYLHGAWVPLMAKLITATSPRLLHHSRSRP
jgi:hypothetical protein